MIRLPRAVSLALACALVISGCQRTLPPAPVTQGSGSAPAAGAGLEKVHGEWEADRSVQLRASPSAGGAVVGSLQPGQAVTVLGRTRGTDWVAVKASGTTAYVRMHLLRLRGSAPVTARGTTTVLPKAEDNAGPAIKAAPRRKIEAAPIAP
ncbi:SH3 domain-containing protein [Azospirillum sp. SYSU D00513]|uniref:SH3 domain-containing protein n=1 Tax=Azospirillum sp. SYSU D00513 TaxID=2812561 RepID=UPI001A961185|nr:SH3 domain-containing protein [Azospirillum sp. SYSU D00513]